MKQHWKKALALLCVCTLCASLLSFGAFADETGGENAWGDVAQDNFVRVSSAEALSAGQLQDVEVTEEVGDGAVRLADGAQEGVWTSQEISVPAFEYLVASWGADTPDGTWVEVKVRAYVDMKKEWSGFLSWGKWGIDLKRGSTDPSNALATVDTDTFYIKGSDGETASKLQFQVTLHSNSAGVTPTLRNVSATLKNTLDGQAIPIYIPDDSALPEKVLLDTPCYSQMVRDASIGNVICSPTTMTMMLNDRGLNLFPEEVALREYDFNYEGFGNWAYTVAIAGSYGFSAYAHYADLDFVRHELAAGRSVALSVQYSSSPNGSYPYLENGAANSTGGHLIGIVGYETVDGVDYFYSNDSAAGSDTQSALRRYKAEQLDVCWSSRIAYVVNDAPENGAGQDAPRRVEAELTPTADNINIYELSINGEPMDLGTGFSAKTKKLGAGTAFLITDNAKQAELPDPVTPTEANKDRIYLSLPGGTQVNVNAEKAVREGAKSGTVYVIRNDGITYVANVSFEGLAPEEPEAPVQPEPPTEPETPVEPEAPGDKTGFKALPWIGGGAVVVIAGAAAAYVFAKKKK